MAQTVKNLSAMRETQVRSLGWENLLEKEMATPCQDSCLEDSKDRGAWQAAVHRVAESWTGLTDRHLSCDELLDKVITYFIHAHTPGKVGSGPHSTHLCSSTKQTMLHAE